MRTIYQLVSNLWDKFFPVPERNEIADYYGSLKPVEVKDAQN